MYRALVVVGKSSDFSWVLAHFPFLPKLVNTNFQAFQDLTEIYSFKLSLFLNYVTY